MADLPERDAALLLDMLLAARDARSFVKDLNEAAFLASRLHQNAVIRSLEVLGEAASKISADTKGRYPGIPWREIVGCAIASSTATEMFALISFGRWRTSISFR